ncbi:unnamed protein product [Clavelina lepadiformis]|uniref:Uncharacterized protein n=1 Tax=Clavelina lepadiformis TaxID=159417 RepID=A0ABP0F3M4_CLALP
MTSERGVRYLPQSKRNSLQMTLVYPIPFRVTPAVKVNVLGIGSRFQAEGIVSTSLAFQFTVTRTDTPDGWTESPMMIWKAIGPEVPDPKGFQKIGNSDKNTLDVTVSFSEPRDEVPNIFAWVLGTFANQITYAVQIGSINSGGFQCTVRRTDDTNGWDQNPTLFWTIIDNDSNHQISTLENLEICSEKCVCGTLFSNTVLQQSVCSLQE